MSVIIYLILFLIGFVFMEWYAKNRKYALNLKYILVINIIWFVIDLSLGSIFLYLFGNNFLFDFFIIGIKILLGPFIVSKVDDKKIGESLEFIAVNQALLFVVALNLGLMFGIGNTLEFYMREFIQISTIGIILIFIFPIIGFFIGILLTRFYLRKIKWGDMRVIVIMLNLIWLILDIPFALILHYLSLENLFFHFVLISLINIMVGTAIFKFVFFKEIKNSLVIVSAVQSSILGSFLLICVLIVFFPILENFNDLGSSVLTFYISLITILGTCIIFSYYGNKIQLVGYEKLIALITLLPGFIFIINTFFTQLDAFVNDFIFYLIISIGFSILSGFTIKRISYTTILYQVIRDLIILEKGKDLLKIEGLKVHYPLMGGILKRQIGAVKAVDGLSFNIKTGETLALVGESGCGKTTVARAILGLVSKDGGMIFFHNKPMPEVYSSYLRQKIQIVFQDPDASLNPRMKVVDIIAEPLRNLLGITNKAEIRTQVLRLLEEVSLNREHLDRYPHEFSGGQKQRIIIARALACNPELIILDEPTSALDVSVQAQILNLLKDLQNAYGYGYLFITHNLSVVNHIADRIEVMYLGKIVEEGNTDQIFMNPSHPYTKALLASRSEIDPYNQNISFVIKGEVPSPINPPSGCPFNPRCSSESRTKECELKFPQKIKIEEDHFIWCTHS
ncbi:MAG: ABC transporter ATP-binding protein [Candidatus Thorarchaeota archaeon]